MSDTLSDAKVILRTAMLAVKKNLWLKNTYFKPNFVAVLKVLEHFVHWNALSLLCLRLLWPFNWWLVGNPSWHKSQIKGFNPKCVALLCSSNWLFSPKLLSQALHLWGFSWTPLIWTRRFFYKNEGKRHT